MPPHTPPSDAAADVLVVDDLSITFAGLPSGFSLVDHVSFRVRVGCTLCLVGESGCGKSIVSLSLMGLLARPPAKITSGRILFGGRDLLTLGPEELSDLRGNRMTMIFQEPMTSLNPAFTIGDQLTEVILRHQKVSMAEAAKRAIAVLQQMRIPAPEARLKAYPHQMSGGMRQRIMIAMALANSPRLLIADEPTTALDVTVQAQIVALLQQLQARTGVAILLISHDLALVRQTYAEFDSLKPQTVIDRLKPLAVKGAPWFGSAGELLAVAYLQLRRNREAGALFGEIAKDQKVPESLRQRAVQMAGVLGVDAIDQVEEKKPQ